MTGNRVLKGVPKAGVGVASPDATKAPAAETPPGTIGKLQDVVARLQTIEKLNNNLQGQYAQGSAAWESCERIDDELHKVFTLLGE